MLYITEKNGKRRKAKTEICLNCGRSFLQRINGKRKFCSHECSYSYKRRDRVEVKCERCGLIVKRVPSKLKNSRHGIHFCSRECKDIAQSLKGNCTKIQPAHYGTSEGRETYKNLVKKTLNPTCACGENKVYLLEVHHKDGDRTNNDIDNLEIVCANCHLKRHLKLIDNVWKYSSKYLTPRDMVFEL